MKLEALVREYLIEIEVRKYTPKTIRSHRNNLNLFLRFCRVKTSGMDFDRIMPSVSRLGEGNRAAKRQGVITRVMRVFEKYSGAAQKVIEYDQKEMRTVLQLPVNAAAKRRGVGGGAS